MIRKLFEESNFDKGDDLSDWNSCVGESDGLSTTSGFESASEGWSDEEPWGADVGLELCEIAVPGEETPEPGPPAWLGTRGHPPGRRVNFEGDLGEESGDDASIDYGLIDGTWKHDERDKGVL